MSRGKCDKGQVASGKSEFGRAAGYRFRDAAADQTSASAAWQALIPRVEIASPASAGAGVAALLAMTFLGDLRTIARKPMPEKGLSLSLYGRKSPGAGGILFDDKSCKWYDTHTTE